VIKVENAAFPDGARQSSPGARMSVVFAAGHRNKLGLGLNLRDPQGKALLRQLLTESDVLLSNFKPGTLDSLGFDLATLQQINPRLIAVDSSAFGPTGPWSGRMGYGPLVRAASGMTANWCYPGEANSFSDAMTVYPDHVAARFGLLGLMALLIRRERSGYGGSVSVSQLEVIMQHLAPQIARQSLHAAGQILTGTDEPDAPWAVYPCAGDDEWCVVTVRGDGDFRALCAALGRPELIKEARFSDAAARRTHRTELDDLLRAWLTQLPARQAMELLQARGIPAAAMLRVAELPEFDFYRERNFFHLFKHTHIETPFYLENAPVHSRRLPDPPQNSAPLVGEHTLQIVKERLRLSETEGRRLVEAGVLELPPPAAK
jgi:crotonobetainyl-CoA:carnitine CoA-transferase CaiB-like acyl-CoA transferase